MQIKPTLAIIALAAAMGTAAHAAPQSISGALQAQILSLKNDGVLILAPHVKKCEPPGLVDRAISPDVQKVCTVEAEVLISPTTP